MKPSRLIPIRFPVGDEKRIRIYAIENDKTFSAAVRLLCNKALSDERPAAQQQQMRRVLSRGVE
jgi:hypothetical protein